MPCETYIHMLNMHRFIHPVKYPYNKYNKFYLQHVQYNTVHSVGFFFYRVYILPFDLVHILDFVLKFVVWLDSMVRFDSVVEFGFIAIDVLLLCYISSSYIDKCVIDHVYLSVYNIALSHFVIIHVLINLKKKR